MNTTMNPIFAYHALSNFDESAVDLDNCIPSDLLGYVLWRSDADESYS